MDLGFAGVLSCLGIICSPAYPLGYFECCSGSEQFGLLRRDDLQNLCRDPNWPHWIESAETEAEEKIG
jgi:hypothetical protein